MVPIGAWGWRGVLVLVLLILLLMKLVVLWHAMGHLEGTI